MRVFSITGDHLGVDEYDVAAQRLVSYHHHRTGVGRQVFASPHRYVWPAELDLMARMADMSLVERWADWHRSPFTGESGSHVSVWRRSG